MDERYTLISYGPEIIEHHTSADLADILSHVQKEQISWIIVRGVEELDSGEIERLLSAFGADTALAGQIRSEEGLGFSDQPSNCLFFQYTVPTTHFDQFQDAYLENRGSVILGERVLLLFDETEQGFSDEMQRSLRLGRTRAQEFGADYLLYLLIRLAIGHFEELISGELFRRVEELEDDIMGKPGDDENLDKLIATRGIVRNLYEPLRQLALFTNSLRDEAVGEISADTLSLFTQHLLGDIEELERDYLRLRDMLKELLDFHRASVSEISNSKMNLLTIVSTIFLPITFISGVYGMNFASMPGTDYPYGFQVAMLLMVIIVAVEIVYLKRNGFFS